MGEVADDMIAGRSCSECGVYFKREHGHPVLCTTCHDSATQEKREPSAPRAYHSEL